MPATPVRSSTALLLVFVLACRSPPEEHPRPEKSPKAASAPVAPAASADDVRAPVQDAASPGNGAPASPRREATSVTGIPVTAPAAHGEPAPYASPAAVALAYTKAFAERDWEAVCQTRVPEERKRLAELGGSCEKAFAAMAAGKPVQLLASVEVSDVRIKGKRAGIDLVQHGQERVVMTVVATQVRGGWLLEDVKDDEAP